MKKVDRFPKRICVRNEDGESHSTGVFDAETGEPFLGALRVSVTQACIEVEATKHWPPTSIDYVANQVAPYEGPQFDGVVTVIRKYIPKHIEIETY